MSQKFVTDEMILKAIETKGNADAVLKELGFKSLSTLQSRIGRIQQKQQKFINLPGLYPEKKTGGGVLRDPKINKNGHLEISKNWLKETDFKPGDTFTVKIAKDKKITLTRKTPVEAKE